MRAATGFHRHDCIRVLHHSLKEFVATNGAIELHFIGVIESADLKNVFHQVNPNYGNIAHDEYLFGVRAYHLG